ncbi:DNA-binding transcriptional regulator, XRE-family HTH domain [Pilibacter termitis]|uniref:DNA-binding transcriptional regulator, XRE-family HTH domain n=1 Tax=Pilibacter termitis TaxID=263852 RepID=A0A1T4N3W7_9ENTE|nr:helix-turn-helix transcriptional regulator [Pilibacter termitis]SJZ74029.1 DNA-binding transcriptional regulator, XRE-family HTH domain [Pilibacter termitis]
MDEQLVRKLRVESGISQRKMAEKVFVSRTTYQKFERGEYDPPISFIKRVAEVLQVDYNLLVSSSVRKNDIEKVLTTPLSYHGEELNANEKLKISIFIRLLKGQVSEKDYFLNLLQEA